MNRVENTEPNPDIFVSTQNLQSYYNIPHEFTQVKVTKENFYQVYCKKFYIKEFLIPMKSDVHKNARYKLTKSNMKETLPITNWKFFETYCENKSDYV